MSFLRNHLQARADMVRDELLAVGVKCPRFLIDVRSRPPAGTRWAGAAWRSCNLIAVFVGDLNRENGLPARYWPWYRRVVIHEITHLIAPRGQHSHGKEFRRVASRISKKLNLSPPSEHAHRSPGAARHWPFDGEDFFNKPRVVYDPAPAKPRPSVPPLLPAEPRRPCGPLGIAWCLASIFALSSTVRQRIAA